MDAVVKDADTGSQLSTAGDCLDIGAENALDWTRGHAGHNKVGRGTGPGGLHEPKRRPRNQERARQRLTLPGISALSLEPATPKAARSSSPSSVRMHRLDVRSGRRVVLRRLNEDEAENRHRGSRDEEVNAPEVEPLGEGGSVALSPRDGPTGSVSAASTDDALELLMRAGLNRERGEASSEDACPTSEPPTCPSLRLGTDDGSESVGSSADEMVGSRG